MSFKRSATTDLNHENWDQDDPADHEDMGTYKIASKDELQKRVIRTAKRRCQPSSGDEVKKSVFSGFGGFNKTQPSSFDFLANLTNGNKTNGSPLNKNENTVSSSIFNKTPITTSSSPASIFSSPVSTAATIKTNFTTGVPQGIFNISSSSTGTTSTSLFTGSRADSTVIDSPFKTSALKPPINTAPQISTSQVSSTIFGIPNNTTTTTQSLFSKSSVRATSTPFKIQPVTSTTPTTNKTQINSVENKTSNTSSEDKEEDSAKLTYYAKLKALNESVSDWIKKHVEETPVCILTPIFKDYERHLKDIQAEAPDVNKSQSEVKDSCSSKSPSEKSIPSVSDKKSSSTTISTGATSSNSTLLASNSNSETSVENKPATSFKFGIQPTLQTAVTANSGFSFGMNKAVTTTSTAASATPFSFASQANGTTSTPFSFGIGQKFSFSPNTQKTVTSEDSNKQQNEDEDEPPKVEFTPVVEENSVYDKKCKIFVKKDGNFADKGVGTLYIKKIEDSGKHQLLVRANTNLGTVLLNLVLVSAIPTQRMGKNNVMLVCIPTPEAKPPPTSVLIRVKTAEEADDLLETLNKYKT